MKDALAIKAYAQAINDQGIGVEKILLFGSYAQGDARSESDIDLIIVSPDFRRMPAPKRWKVLGKAAATLMEPIEALAYTPVRRCITATIRIVSPT